MTPTEAHAKDVRGAILTEATRLFRERGVDGFSMRQLAEAIGYSATTIYLHFEDKNHLMYAVCESGFAEFGASLGRAAASSPDHVARMRAVGRAYVDFALANPLHYEVMFIRPKAWAIGPMTDAIHGADRPEPESFAAFVAMVEAAIADGAFALGDPREVSAQFWSGIHGVVSLAISMNDQMAIFDDDAVRRRGEEVVDALLARFVVTA